LQARKAAGKTAVAVSLTLSFHEMELLDCDVAFVEMMDE
jgi:MinD superfamily P-loop ATPase